MKFSLSLALAATVALAPGCGDDDPTAPSDGVRYGADVQPIFSASCTPACHSGATPNGGLDLTPGNSHGELVGVAALGYPGYERVVAGDAGASLLYLKLVGDPGVGNRMPLSGSLDSLRIDTVRRWIDEGARND